MSSAFFPPRIERDTLDFVLTEFPFPLALTYARLHQQMDLQEPIAAAWQLRDAFECLIKFTAVWEQASHDSVEVVEGVQVIFRDFDPEYQRSDYLLDTLWRVVEEGEHTKGYIHLVGPEEVGKTYAVRGLEREGRDRGAPVLAYHVLPGALTDYRTFIAELADRASEALRFRTNEAQLAVTSFTERELGRLAETLSSYDEAIAILRQLVEEENRQELAGDLAIVLTDKALALEQRLQLQEALPFYEEAIHW